MARRQSRGLRLGVLALGIGLLVALVPAAMADDIAESKGFRKAVTTAGIREHQAAFQAHADANGGNRVAGSAGYEASANYVVGRMTTAGYNVSSNYFTFVFNADSTPPVLQRVTAPAKTYVDSVDFASMTFSPNGDHTASVTAVDLVLPVGPANSSTSGCQTADFAGFPAGSIALIQRGTCTFGAKAQNAAAAGAVAVIIFNEGQAGRTAIINGTLGGPVAHTAPVVGTTFAVGDELRNGVLNGPTGITARVRVDRVNETRTTRNIIAETPGGDPDRVVVVGAHLDSVTRGPGINDNGSGSGGLLEIAEVYAAQGRVPRNKIRFMWFGAEEFGLLGSRAYVAGLSPDELARIELMLNFDMIGSPNYVRFVYDGDGSATSPAGPPGSAFVEDVFIDYFNSQNLASEPTQFSGRSDYGPFIAAGIPAGGLFTGAEGAKTAAQAAIYGGLAGVQYDPCYHLACDTFAGTGDGPGATAPGLALKALDEMSDATAHAVLFFSRTKVDVAQTAASAATRSANAARAEVDFPDHDAARVGE